MAVNGLFFSVSEVINMIPSIVGRELEERFQGLLKTQFRVRKDGAFSRLWADFFSRGDKLIKGPYLELPLPYRKSTDVAELTRFSPAIEKLPFPPYEHQVRAFDRISAFKSTLVATGTGSGKTECFSLPILAHCAKYAGENGIRAILIYPMNALATDQAKRLAELICTNAGLKGVRVGLYIGEGKGRRGRTGARPAQWREVGFDAGSQSYHVITDRGTILNEPPHILLTNYKMLDYLLLRPKEKVLWRFNKNPNTLKFLAVDELHTFDGAQAADLACLLRRLKEYLRLPDENLCCIGTSATLGSSEAASDGIRKYAQKVFSSSFPPESLVTEDRYTFDEMAAGTKDVIFSTPLARTLFSALKGPAKTLDVLSGVVAKAADDELWDDAPKSRQVASEMILGFCSELSTLRGTKGRDYPDVKFQYWIREMARLVASVPHEKSDDGGWRPSLRFADDLEDPDRMMDGKVRHFPLDNCNVCGATAWIGLIGRDGAHLEGTRRQIYNEYFARHGGDDVRFLYPLAEEADSIAATLPIKKFCGKCSRLNPDSAEKCECGNDKLIRVAVAKNGDACPWCGHDHGNRLLVGMRSATMLSTCISTLTTSPHNGDKKILTFSDNVQDTSQRAGFFGGRTWAATFRAHLAQYFASLGVDEVGYGDFIDGFYAYLKKRLADDRDILAELIPQDLKWLNAWRGLRGNDPPAPDARTMKALMARLRWEIAMEVGCGQHLGRTLERMGVLRLEMAIPEGLAVDEQDFLKRIAPDLIKAGAFEDRSLLNSKGDTWSSILTTALNRGGIRFINGLDAAGIPVYKSKRSAEPLVPGVTSGKKKYAILSEINDPRDAEMLSLLAKKGVVREFTHTDGATRYWYLPIESLVVKKHPEAAAHAENPFHRQYLHGDIHRVNPAEHTGLLNREEREALEIRFKAKDSRKWDPNLISATPTLEMGVDIGDLSSVLLCSVPPTQSKFIQRVGRSGRRNGSALNITVAASSPHDLYFFRNPAAMISGNVTTPGVFLDASAILERQYLAFALSEWMLAFPECVLPDSMGRMFKALDDAGTSAFPNDFFAWYSEAKGDLFDRFRARLGNFNQIKSHTLDVLNEDVYHNPLGKTGICGRIKDAVASAKTLLKNYENKKRDLAKLKKEVAKDPGLTEDLRAQRIEDVDRELKAYYQLTRTLLKKPVIEWLSDTAGLLPNYAFPEPGVSLQTILWRRESQAETGKLKFDKFEVLRPASSGITELVPGSTFYTHAHHMLIDQIDLQSYSDDEIASCEWRLCPECDHIEKNGALNPVKCPVCGADWSNNAQVRKLLPARQFVTVCPDRSTINDDSNDDRDKERYECRKFFDRDAGGGKIEGFRCEGDGIPFAFEYVPHLVMREVNFGKRAARREGEVDAVANGETLTGLGFDVCRECNKAVSVEPSGMSSIKHVATCKTLLSPSDEPATPPLNMSFYREYHTEALRIFAPFLGEDSDVRIVSFMAAIQLGLKEYFKGEVDHLQMETQSVPLQGKSVRQHFLILYDAVPGGTGYIRQFADGDRPRLIFDIFETALKKLKSCTCASDPTKDGCYECLYRYRNQSIQGKISRQEAVNVLEELLPRRKHLVRVTGEATAGLSMASLIDSELEKQFLNRLNAIVSAMEGGQLEDATVRGYVKGWRMRLPGVFRLGADQRLHEWEIVPQKDLGPSDGVLVPSRPDFVFYPLVANGVEKANPVAVFLDGWEFHQSIIADDVIKRKALMEAGYRVWSLGWDDVVAAKQAKPVEQEPPAWRKNLAEPACRKNVGSKFYADKGERAEAWQDIYNAPNQEIERLLAYLGVADDTLFTRHAEFETMVMLVSGADKSVAPAVKGILPHVLSAHLDGDLAVTIKEPLFAAGIGVVKDESRFGKTRGKIAAALDDTEVPAKQAWEAFWGFATYFQFLGDDMLAFTFKSRDDRFWSNLKTAKAVIGTEANAEWDAAMELAEGEALISGVLLKLRELSLPPPLVFDDIMAADGSVSANAWLQWPDKKVMVLGAEDAPPDVSKSWRVISVADGASVETVTNSIKEAFNV